MTFVTLITGIALFTKLVLHWRTIGWDDAAKVIASYSAISLLVSFGMLLRYLKFHRLFSVEVLVTFASSLEQEPARE